MIQNVQTNPRETCAWRQTATATGKKICLTAFDLILLNKKYEIYNFK